MSSLTRAGFTLHELLVSLAVFGLLSALAVALLRQTQTLYRAQAEGIEARRNLQVAAAFLPAELRELDATEGDLVAIARTAVTLRATRQLAVLCRTPRLDDWPAPVSLTIAVTLFSALRDFAPATDSIWVFAERNPGTSDDDGWIRGSISAPLPDTCPDGRPARRLSATLFPGPGQTMLRGTIQSGAPIRGFETLTYRLYRSSEDNRWYVGMKTASDLQPVLGPVTGDGLDLAYVDSAGALVTDPGTVRLIEVRVRAPTAKPVRLADGRLATPLDSLVAAVSLRNNRRF